MLLTQSTPLSGAKSLLGSSYGRITGHLCFLSAQRRNVLFWSGGNADERLPFRSASIVQNGGRCRGFASPCNYSAPLTAPRRSETFSEEGKGKFANRGL